MDPRGSRKTEIVDFAESKHWGQPVTKKAAKPKKTPPKPERKRKLSDEGGSSKRAKLDNELVFANARNSQVIDNHTELPPPPRVGTPLRVHTPLAQTAMRATPEKAAPSPLPFKCLPIPSLVKPTGPRPYLKPGKHGWDYELHRWGFEGDEDLHTGVGHQVDPDDQERFDECEGLTEEFRSKYGRKVYSWAEMEQLVSLDEYNRFWEAEDFCKVFKARYPAKGAHQWPCGCHVPPGEDDSEEE